MCWCICHHANCWIFGCEQSVKMGMLRKRVMCALLMAPKVYHGKRVGGVRLMAAFFIFHKMWKCGGMCVLFSIKFSLSLSYTCAMDLFVLVLACVYVYVTMLLTCAAQAMKTILLHSPRTHTFTCVCAWVASSLPRQNYRLNILFQHRTRRALHSTEWRMYEFLSPSFLIGILRTLVHVHRTCIPMLYELIVLVDQLARKKLIRNTEQWINLQWV